MKRMAAAVVMVVWSAVSVFPAEAADQFKIAIMQDQAGTAKNFSPLIEYMAKKGIDVTFVSAPDYPASARLFAAGGADAMFSGSGIAGALIIKELADPLVRPVGADGNSTYWAVVVAPKGAPAFTGRADYFNGKKVILTGLASSGEFFYRSLPGADKASAVLLKAASHGAALDTLHRGLADVAIVKNRVWDKVKGKYPELVLVGEDKGENPDGTLMVSRRTKKALAEKVEAALESLKDDGSGEASAVRASLGVQGYVKTQEKDFSHTLKLLRSAGVTKSFAFSFK